MLISAYSVIARSPARVLDMVEKVIIDLRNETAEHRVIKVLSQCHLLLVLFRRANPKLCLRGDASVEPCQYNYRRS